MSEGAKKRRDRQAIKDAVEYLCRNLDALKALIDPSVWAAELPLVEDAEPDSPQWRDAVTRLHEAAAEAGLPGGLGLGTTMGDSWLPAPPPRVTGWVCPAGRCGRVELAPSGASPGVEPSCDLAGQAMRYLGDQPS